MQLHFIPITSDKFGRWYDMVWMEKLLGSHPIPAPELSIFPS